MKCETFRCDAKGTLIRALVGTLVMGCSCFATAAQDLAPMSTEAAEETEAFEATSRFEVVIHLTDGGEMICEPLSSSISIETRHGRLTIPANEITRLRCAVRPDPMILAEIDLLMKDLAADEMRFAEVSERLAELQRESFFVVQAAMNDSNPLVSQRAEAIIEAWKTQEGFDPELLLEHDILETAEMRIIGRLTTDFIAIRTAQFGDLQLKYSDLAMLRDRTLQFEQPEEEQGEVLPDPGNLTGYYTQVGKKFRFRVVGATTGSLWGTEVYTSDSNLATAAVHAGVLQVGEAGIVTVEIIATPNQFTASNQNGVLSRPYGVYSGAYRLRARQK